MELQQWKKILIPYELAVEELIVKFNHIKKEYLMSEQYSPIESVTGRVKQISSIVEKCQKKNIPLEDATAMVEDIAGIRIICQFEDDINQVADIIRRRSDMHIKSEKDYVKYPKKSGYRSYHVIVDYNVETKNGMTKIPVEIQIRTMAMNFWAVAEHSLQYKYRGNLPDDVRERLNSAAEAIVTLDSEMSNIRDEIMDAQTLFNNKAQIVSQILTNIQNLYRSENRDAMLNIQTEFYNLYHNGTIEELQEFNKQLDMIAARKNVQKDTD